MVHNMSTIQLKVTLPRQLHALLKKQADNFGLTLSSYVKNLIIEDIKKDDWRSEFIVTDEDLAKSSKEAMENPISDGDVVITTPAELDKFFKEL